MSDITREALLNARLQHRRPGRRFLTDESMRWGELVEPALEELREKPAGGLRLVVLCSFPIGYLVLRSIELLERAAPGLVSLVGVVTDDPINADARIGLKKRIWHLLPRELHLGLETALVEAGLQFGVPVFTGDTKSTWFHEHLRDWHPDALMVCGFGQLIDPVVLATAPLGVNNLHPADLAAGIGNGPSPHEAVLARGDPTTAWTVHLMDEAFDSGPPLGTSAPINVRQADGAPFERPFRYYDKALDGLDFIAVAVATQLAAARAAGAAAPLERIDISTVLPAAVRETMMAPIDPTLPERMEPMPDADAIRAWLPELLRTIGAG